MIAVCLLAARGALAESQIRVPDGCGSDAEWGSELERLTGAPAATAPPVDVEIVPIGPASGFELRLSIDGERRVLRDPVCRVLWRSALVIAAASRSQSAPETPAPVAPAPETPAAPLPEATARPTPLPSTSSPSPIGVPEPSAVSPSSPRPPSTATTTTRPLAPAARTAAARTTPAARRPRRSDEAVAASAIGAEPAPAGPDREARPLRLGVGVGVGISSGVVPGWGPVLDASMQLEALPWAVALSLRYWPERDQSREDRSVLVSALGGRAAALFRVAPALSLLGGLELNRLAGEGAAAVRGPAADVAWQLAPVLGLSMITMDIGYLRLELGALARANVLRPRFVVTGFGTLYRAPALGADAIIRTVVVF